ncbi:hypothetical protein N493_13080 [Clostridium botulinum B2 433]|uniref:class I SAM-dependent methyltransferase n=1 Tax=Clostridium botulinum TaxID=1491 RepID=UPI0007DF1517|nr:class I SAM-dependent methyltransferase [Clostridium botulinum]KEI90373.1 hypothetical protein N493_13080 [Clostridium botulinum B2 433]
MTKVVIFGTAINAVVLFETGGFNKNVKIVACIDNSHKRIGEKFYGNTIRQPSEIVNIDFDYVLITSRTNFVNMANQLISYSIPANKIIISYEEGHIDFFENKLGGHRAHVLSRPSSYRTEAKYNNVELMHDLVNDNIVTQIPIELIRVASAPQAVGDVISSVVNNIVKDAKMDYQIYRSPYYTELFEYLSGESDKYPANYMNLFHINEVSHADKVLIMRREFYDKHMKLLQKGFSYYKDHCEPIVVKYNKDGGFFSIIDGLHRATFLYSKGIRHIYAMMSYDDYNAYINKDKITPIIKHLSNLNITDVYGAILHPTFYNYSSLRDAAYPTRVELAFKALRGYDMKGKRIIDIGCNNGYNARMFAREGVCVTAVEMDKNIFELARAISELENTKVNYINGRFEDIEEDQRFDIALLMTVLYWYLETPDILEAFFDRLNTMICEMIIWESGDQPEVEKNLIIKNTKFKNYKKLSVTVGTGKLREFGIFTV